MDTPSGLRRLTSAYWRLQAAAFELRPLPLLGCMLLNGALTAAALPVATALLSLSPLLPTSPADFAKAVADMPLFAGLGAGMTLGAALLARGLVVILQRRAAGRPPARSPLLEFFEREGEPLRFGPANRRSGWGADPGFLVLTQRRLYWRHLHDPKRTQLVALEEIVRTEPSWFLFPSGLDLYLRDGTRLRLVISPLQRDAWLEAVDAARANAQFGGPQDPAQPTP